VLAKTADSLANPVLKPKVVVTKVTTPTVKPAVEPVRPQGGGGYVSQKPVEPVYTQPVERPGGGGGYVSQSPVEPDNMGWLQNTTKKIFKEIAVDPITKNFVAEAEKKGFDVRPADAIVKDVMVSEPVTKFGKESANIVKAWAVTAGGFAVAPAFAGLSGVAAIGKGASLITAGLGAAKGLGALKGGADAMAESYPPEQVVNRQGGGVSTGQGIGIAALGLGAFFLFK